MFLSHRLAWRRIVDEALDFAFIFEDDAEIEPARFAALVEFATLERPAWDYVLLPAQPISKRRGRREPQRFYPHTPGRAPLKSDRPDRLACRREAPPRAHAALRSSRYTLLQMTWVTGQPVLVASPSPVRDVSPNTGGSTVQRKSMSLVERLRHEALRPL